jgi:hypothetical protein
MARMAGKAKKLALQASQQGALQSEFANAREKDRKINCLHFQINQAQQSKTKTLKSIIIAVTISP